MLEITTFLCGRRVPFGPRGRCKATGPVFICHLLEIRRNENTNLTHGDVFTHNWFPRYAALQLYGLLVDLVWTGLLSLAALNKHLLEVKKVGYASRKIKFMLQNSSEWNTSLLYKVFFLSFCHFDTKLTGWKMPPKLLHLSFFLPTAPTDHRSLGHLHLYSQSKDNAVTFPVTSASIPQGRTAITRPSTLYLQKLAKEAQKCIVGCRTGLDSQNIEVCVDFQRAVFVLSSQLSTSGCLKRCAMLLCV